MQPSTVHTRQVILKLMKWWHEPAQLASSRSRGLAAPTKPPQLWLMCCHLVAMGSFIYTSRDRMQSCGWLGPAFQKQEAILGISQLGISILLAPARKTGSEKDCGLGNPWDVFPLNHMEASLFCSPHTLHFSLLLLPDPSIWMPLSYLLCLSSFPPFHAAPHHLSQLPTHTN